MNDLSSLGTFGILQNKLEKKIFNLKINKTGNGGLTATAPATHDENRRFIETLSRRYRREMRS